MFGLAMLDVAIGLALVFFMFSLALTAATEAIETFLRTRARDLARGVRELLDDPNGDAFTKAFYDHPLIYSLYRGSYSDKSLKLPSYIPARNFSLAVLDLVSRQSSSPQVSAPSEKVKRVVDLAIQSAGGDLEKTRQELEAWYDSAMDRVSGWYKRRTQVVVLVMALLLTGFGNVNAIAIFQALQISPKLTNALVEQASKVELSETTSSKLEEKLFAAGLPIGWTGAGSKDLQKRWADGVGGGLEIVVGWLLTALAISLGAPFWFDVLNRLMVIRSTVKPHEKSPEEQSEDGRKKDSEKRNTTSGRRDASAGAAAPSVPGAAAAHATGVAGLATLVASDVFADAHEDGCLCDEPADPAEDTADRDLPPATGGVAPR